MPIVSKVSEPLWKGGNRISDISQLNKYHHTIASFGGYDTCDFDISATDSQISDWLSDGLGRDIENSNQSGVIWKGIINTITIQSGEKTITIGPLFEIVNKLHLSYAPIFQTNFGQNIIGSETYLSEVEDEISQARYGIMERVLVGSKMQDTDAAQYQTIKLQDFKNPRTTERQAPLSSTGNMIHLTCIGYHNFLKYPYTNTTTGQADLSLKIASILSSEPNTIFSSSTSKITENLTQVLSRENKANGLSLIKSLTTLGDTSDNRYIFGIYQNNQAEYKPVPIVVEYEQSGSSNNSIIKDTNGSIINPESALAGKWIRYSDLLIGKNQPSDIRGSQNSVFIEKVTFISPKTLIIDGGFGANDGMFQTLMLRGVTV